MTLAGTSNAGRPTRLTAKLAAEVCEAVRASGTRPVRAALYKGVPRATFDRWLRIGRAAEQKPGRSLTDHERRCRQFVHDLDRAEAGFVVSAEVVVVNAMAQKDDRALAARTAQWVLERRLPEEYGRRQDVTVSGPDGGPAAVVTTAEVWAELEKVRRERGEATAAGL